jgi:hypothetical protein
VEILHIGAEAAASNEKVVDELISSYKKSQLKIDMEESHPVKVSKLASRKDASGGFFYSGALIAKRNIVDVLRSPLKVRASIFQTLFLGILIGLIYLQQSWDTSSIQNRIGALYFIATNQVMSSIVSLVNTCKNHSSITNTQQFQQTRLYFLERKATTCIPHRLTIWQK